MIWIEKAIARYFQEPDLHDPKHVDPSPRNVVLFMPYLHWETDRQRERISQLLDKETERYRKDEEAEEHRQKEKRQILRGELVIPKYEIRGESIKWNRAANRKADQITPIAARTATMGLAARMSLYPRLGRLLTSSNFKKDEHGRVLPKRIVGQVLFDAAMLYEAMSNYRDKMFIRQYLHQDPPLHPRRTLDQAYYWTLKTTRTRDRDQVVYRGTKPNPEHSVDPETGQWNCLEVDDLAAEESKRQTQKPDRAKKNRHESHSPDIPLSTLGGPSQQAQQPGIAKVELDESHCIHCRSHIRKVSRLLMVDQLWMWILDEKTIITAFPRRYGMNKQDQSGVHKSIRSRLQNLRQDHIKTVFDLALIILDECSNIFFNRTKTADRHPQILDIFSQAIGNINNKQTISFQHLWDWIDKLSHLSSTRTINTDMSDIIIPLLDIRAEGRLQREIKDIIDELDIMIYINAQQKEVMKKFSKDVENLLKLVNTEQDNWASARPSSPTSSTSATSATSPNSPTWPTSPTSRTWPTPPTSPINPTVDTAETIKSNERKRNCRWFERNSQVLMDDAEDRITELKGLRQSAESTSTSLDDLLGLKQQQASVVQAWQSVQQAEEAMRQGRAIMIFTVITIVFLPLAFMASIFGMNNPQISGQGPMTITTQFKLMFGISTGIIVIVLVFAYSAFVRNLFWLAYRYLVTLVVVKTPLYDRLYLSLDWKSATLTRKVDNEIKEMKAKVKKAKQTRTTQRLNNEREMAQKMAEEKEERARRRKARASGDQQNRKTGQGRSATGPPPPPPQRANLTHATTTPGPADHEASVGSSSGTRPTFSRPDEGQTSPGRLESGQP
ncbi:hypothetical protein VMCG_09371 [Cytospora schulzeri]|uniref:Ankyrin repeat protein n=1 Tax=Cytospora schulzeri TaxID=448051 RepID=A0A423VJM2_9PEZI|nr:hypothetical protein VMCG_09371 [Valsa malicola]